MFGIEQKKYSAVQEQFYLSFKLNPENTAYNLPSLCELKGIVNRNILDKTLEKMDICNLGIESCSIFYHKSVFTIEKAAEIINTPFDIDRGECFRIHVWMEENKTSLLFVFHHIIFDLRSKDIFAEYFSEIYNALAKGEEPDLKTASSYEDYIDWYGEFSSSDKYLKMLTYWKKGTMNSSLLTLPSDKERASTPSSEGHRLFGTLSEDLTTDLEAYCQKNSTDPFLVLLSAYALFLHRFSGQEEFSIGIPRTNRPAGFENTMGCFVNILPLYLQMEEEMNFKTLLKHVRLKMLGMHRNQYIPYLEVIKLPRRKRDPKYNPLFQVGFTFEHPMSLKLNGLECTPLDAAPDAAQLDLFFYFWRDNNGFRYAVEYCSDLFTRERVDGFIASFLNILYNAVQNDLRCVKTLPLLDSVSEKRILKWNSTDKPYDYPRGIHQYFLKQVGQIPEKTALVFRDQTMTYKEFYQKVAVLASYLKEKGVEKETIVGLSLERSFEMIIGMYAIVLAGGTYMPIEPTLPADYISYILEDSQTGIILSKTGYSGLFPDSVDFISLDSFNYSLSSPLSELPPVSPDDRVYILYTSGSTGRPKGVEITHRGLINRLLWMDDEYRLTDEDVLFQKTPYNFDVSGWEFWWPLMKGNTLIIAEPEGHKDNTYLIDMIEKEKISILHFVPSMLREFLNTSKVGDCSSLRDVICSGEALPAAVVRDFYERFPQSRLHNLYGPTEASIDVTYGTFTTNCNVGETD
jgi:non-ribosomal peptide synthetase component F